MFTDSTGYLPTFVVTTIFGAVIGAITGGIEAYLNGDNIIGGIIQGGLEGAALGFAFGTGITFLGPVLAAAGSGTLTTTMTLSSIYAFLGSTAVSFSLGSLGYMINEEMNSRDYSFRKVFGYGSLIAVSSVISYTFGGIVGQFGTVGELRFPTNEWWLKQGLYRVYASPSIYLIDKLADTLYQNEDR